MSEVKKKRELTEMQQKFLEALGGEAKGKIREAMRIAGYSENVKTSDVVNSLVDEIKLVAERLMAMNTVKAVHGILDTIDRPDKIGAATALAAAKELLDRVGIVKKEQQQTQIKAGTVYILPAKNSPAQISLDTESDPE